MDLQTILSWFKRGCKPTEAQFAATFRSFRHKDDAIPMGDVAGLAYTLANKSDKGHTHTLAEISDYDGGDKEVINAMVAEDSAELDAFAKTEGMYYILLSEHLLYQYLYDADTDTYALAETEPDGQVVYSAMDADENVHIYIYNVPQLTFQDVTNDQVDKTIYTNNLDSLITKQLPNGVYSVVYVNSGIDNNMYGDAYTLTVGDGSMFGRILECRSGWAKTVLLDEVYQWEWNHYSYRGHTHEIADVNGLQNKIEMPDFAWWQKRTANKGARVLMTMPEIMPANHQRARLTLEVACVRRDKNSNGLQDSSKSTFTIPKNVTNLYVENFGCSRSRDYVSGGYIGSWCQVTVAVSNGNGDVIFDYQFVLGAIKESMQQIPIPKTIVGVPVSIEVNVSWIRNDNDKVVPTRFRFYADSEEVLSSYSKQYRYDNGDIVTVTEYDRMRGNGFSVAYFDEHLNHWRILPYTNKTARCKRHFLECRIRNYFYDGVQNFFIERGTWRTFDRPIFSQSSLVNFRPAFIRACTSSYHNKRYGYFRPKCKTMRWLVGGGKKAQTRQIFDSQFTLKHLPFSYKMVNGKHVRNCFYLDVLFAETRQGNRRPFVKTLCLHYRRTITGEKVVYKYIGEMQKPRQQF